MIERLLNFWVTFAVFTIIVNLLEWISGLHFKEWGILPFLIVLIAGPALGSWLLAKIDEWIDERK